MKRIILIGALLALMMTTAASAGLLPRFFAKRLGPPVDFGVVEAKGQGFFCLNNDETRTRWEVIGSQQKRLNKRVQVGDILEVYAEHGFAGGWKNRGRLKRFRPSVPIDLESCQPIEVVGNRSGELRGIIASEEPAARSSVVGDFTPAACDSCCPDAETCPTNEGVCALLGGAAIHMVNSKGKAGHHPGVVEALQILCPVPSLN